jgi:hypothetical protein
VAQTRDKPDKPEKPLSWEEVVVKRIGAAAKKVRGTKSAAWLSQRTKDLGYQIPATVIAKLDSGHRGSVLSVPELLIIAAALDVPPLGLVFPDLPDGQVEIIPRYPGSSFNAYLWAAGMAPSFVNPGARPKLALLVNAVRDRWTALKEVGRLNTRASTEPDQTTRDAYRATFEAAKRQLAQINTEISELGGVINDA